MTDFVYIMVRVIQDDGWVAIIPCSIMEKDNEYVYLVIPKPDHSSARVVRRRIDDESLCWSLSNAVSSAGRKYRIYHPFLN